MLTCVMQIVVFLEDHHSSPSMKADTPPELGAKLFPAFRGFLVAPAGRACRQFIDSWQPLVLELQAYHVHCIFVAFCAALREPHPSCSCLRLLPSFLMPVVHVQLCTQHAHVLQI